MLPRTIDFVVTPDDIRTGYRHGAQTCPIARALLRDYGPGLDSLSVSMEGVSFEIDFVFYGYELDEASKHFIYMFDAYGHRFVEPFEGRLTLHT